MYDTAIIGAGHNGLTCACYLAARGLKVAVFEARNVVGGAAVTHEFAPGFRNSRLSYTVSLLQPKVMRDLRLAEHGLRVVERPMANFLPLPDGRAFCLGPSLADTQASLAQFGAGGVRDGAKLPAYYAMLERVAAVVKYWMLRAPPDLAGGVTGLLDAAQAGHKLLKLDLSAKRDVVDLFTKSAGELLEAWFETPALIAALGWDAQVGHFASPYSPGSAYVLLHHVLGETNGKPGVWGHAIGGMGAITQAMAAEARSRGVTIFTDAPVARLDVVQGRVRGITLADGRVIEARTVAANVHPKLLYQRLVPRDALDAADADFAQRIDRHANGSGTLRMNLALDALPDFTAAPGAHAQAHHGAGIVIAPSLRYMETAYAQARAQGIPEAPIVELLLPSTLDDSLAPPGKHVATLFCQHFNPSLDWDTHKAAAAQKVLDAVEAVAPGFKQSILAQDVLTPLDLEREYGLIGGDIFHGRLTLDQLFAARPVLGAANYRQPIKGLYLCGAGAHPGGGVTGAPGHNAAQVILKSLRALG